MDQAELNRLCQLPGAEGCLWRLCRSWDPDKLGSWIVQERGKLTPDQAISIVAEVMAGAAFVFARGLSGDRQEAMLGSNGMVERLRASIQHKLQQVGGGHQLIIPKRPPSKLVM